MAVPEQYFEPGSDYRHGAFPFPIRGACGYPDTIANPVAFFNTPFGGNAHAACNEPQAIALVRKPLRSFVAVVW
jgi:hypothetical protein